jgi:hypothetical protein
MKGLNAIPGSVSLERCTGRLYVWAEREVNVELD